MEKITLAGKSYELPELNFGAMRKLGKLGFRLTDTASVSENPFEFMSIMVAYITDSTLDEADIIIDNSFANRDEFGKLTEKIVKWFTESDFFKKMQAEKKSK